MYKAADLKKGLKLDIDGEPYVITVFEFSKPGKGQALYRCRLKNMINGNQMDRTYRSGDSFKPAQLESREMQYLYNDGTFYTFMDTKTYDQVQMTESQVGESKDYLIDNLDVEVLMWQDSPIDLTLPNFITFEIIATEPAARGDTTGNVTKPVTLNTGLVIQGPSFLEQGDLISVDTRTGEYGTRVKK